MQAPVIVNWLGFLRRCETCNLRRSKCVCENPNIRLEQIFYLEERRNKYGARKFLHPRGDANLKHRPATSIASHNPTNSSISSGDDNSSPFSARRIRLESLENEPRIPNQRISIESARQLNLERNRARVASRFQAVQGTLTRKNTGSDCGKCGVSFKFEGRGGELSVKKRNRSLSSSPTSVGSCGIENTAIPTGGRFDPSRRMNRKNRSSQYRSVADDGVPIGLIENDQNQQMEINRPSRKRASTILSRISTDSLENVIGSEIGEFVDSNGYDLEEMAMNDEQALERLDKWLASRTSSACTDSGGSNYMCSFV